MATATVTSSTPTAAPISATTPVPAPSPTSAAATSPVPDTTPAIPQPSQRTSNVDPNKYPIREDYARALLEEKMASIADTGEEWSPATANIDEAANEELPLVETGPQDNPTVTSEQIEDPEQAEEPDFDLEPDTPVTPESFSEMLQENAHFRELLDSDPKLKGQLYKTAREAAELKPYREIFADLESAKLAHGHSVMWMDVRDTFLGSTTREGTLTALAKIAELSYERDGDGNVLMQNGQPVIGDDFYGFVDNIAALDLEHRSADIDARLKADIYRSPQERDRDERTKAALDLLREENAASSPAKEDVAEALRLKQEALDRRERELNQRQHGERVGERRSFEHGLQQEAQKRISDGIQRILANVEKQGAIVSPYLKNILPKAIGAKVVRQIQSNPTLQGQMRELQRLPVGDASRQRRLAAIDRAVQQYLPEVARDELREAGVQVAASAAQKRAKLDAQIKLTKKTEPKGATGPSGSGGTALNAGAAFDQARAEWQRANPNRPFDNVAKEQILPRVLHLMSSW